MLSYLRKVRQCQQTYQTKCGRIVVAIIITERSCCVILDFVMELIGCCLKTLEQSQVRASLIVPSECDQNFVGCQTRKELTARS